MTFLGFQIFRALNRNRTGWKVVFQTEGKRFSRATAAMREKLRRMMHWEVTEQVEKINSLLLGHYSYYGIAGNAGKLASFRHLTLRYWKYCLSKRSQKGRIRWEEFQNILQTLPSVPRVSASATLCWNHTSGCEDAYSEEPYARNSHVRFCGGADPVMGRPARSPLLICCRGSIVVAHPRQYTPRRNLMIPFRFIICRSRGFSRKHRPDTKKVHL